ncbi:MAG: FG-GAP repeat protein, partial [Deltaproteobacteria bacterium]|nr:FG-GAP repeat protein [Deltaproteobacteria bacterium]
GFVGSAGGFTRYCLDTLDPENPRRVEGTGLVTSEPATPLQVGRSLAVVPQPGSDPASLAYIVLGAEGSVHLLNASINKALAPSLELPAGDETEDFGVAVAAGLTGTSWPGWVAVGSIGRVYVFGVWDDSSTEDADPDHVWLQACYESGTRPGFGTLLWSADVDGDGATELAVGSHPDTEGRIEDVVVVAGTTFHSGAPPSPYPTVSCMEVPESIVFTCQEYPDRGILCGDYTDFGASFAVGDLDDDGSNEVVIGAPKAKVAGKAGAGAVLVYDPSSPTVPISGLRDSYPEKNAHLGASVAVNDIAGMDEVIAGSPGSNEVFVFYCSGVGNDDPDFHSGNICRTAASP